MPRVDDLLLIQAERLEFQPATKALVVTDNSLRMERFYRAFKLQGYSDCVTLTNLAREEGGEAVVAEVDGASWNALRNSGAQDGNVYRNFDPGTRNPASIGQAWRRTSCTHVLTF